MRWDRDRLLIAIRLLFDCYGIAMGLRWDSYDMATGSLADCVLIALGLPRHSYGGIAC